MITARLTYKIITVGSTVTKGVQYGQLGPFSLDCLTLSIQPIAM